MAKVNQLTKVVLAARAAYPKNLDAILGTLTSPAPYMKQAIDQRTMDRQLRSMSPEDMAAVAQTDPNLAESYAKRIHELTVSAPPVADLPTEWTGLKEGS